MDEIAFKFLLQGTVNLVVFYVSFLFSMKHYSFE